jgi:hypothetical protein
VNREYEQLVGSFWMPQDAFFGDLLFVVLNVMPNNLPDPDVLVLDCQTGKTIECYYDPQQRPGDPEWEVLVCAIEKDGNPLGQQYLLPVRIS